ncbi:endonuclease/exonuclease/phosphatase family protein [Leifsonia sp. ZF2019]|uniref:endonuclease/exonuclease/phosphatase family protein n=1 Tax=Leifsonia sp. ZF2019 TaxID=2781978 RepID=UPI001CBB13FC|nr:endonuclease/exonuclease/phosphatase family protein [Leifsonia sp. ZF2019]UAJ81189.1 endonuclease/exonuclease/phosphatase family protein [Leifsonia sp. ZF2019]
MPSSRTRRRPRGVLTGIAALAVAALLLWHGMLPDIGGAASLVESFLPWAAALIAVLGLSALFRLSLFAGLGVATAAAVWWSLFGTAMLPAASVGAPAFTVVSENIRAGNPEAASIARDLAARSPDLIALQELDATTRSAVSDVLDPAYPYRAIVGTVGLWSTHPLSGEQRLDLGLGWDRALRVDVDTPGGITRVYAVHLASVRPGESATRDEMLKELSGTIAGDDATRLLVIGDFNTATTDRTLAPLLTQLGEKPDSELGLGFTWPASFPAARLDHALTRGLATVSSVVLPENGSDHRGIEVGLR